MSTARPFRRRGFHPYGTCCAPWSLGDRASRAASRSASASKSPNWVPLWGPCRSERIAGGTRPTRSFLQLRSSARPRPRKYRRPCPPDRTFAGTSEQSCSFDDRTAHAYLHRPVHRCGKHRAPWLQGGRVSQEASRIASLSSSPHLSHALGSRSSAHTVDDTHPTHWCHRDRNSEPTLQCKWLHLFRPSCTYPLGSAHTNDEERQTTPQGGNHLPDHQQGQQGQQVRQVLGAVPAEELCVWTVSFYHLRWIPTKLLR